MIFYFAIPNTTVVFVVAYASVGFHPTEELMLDTLPDEDFVAYIPERTFFRDPFDVGDVLLATWSAGRARVLA